MRILIWSDAFWPEIGGLEVFGTSLVTELQRRGHECRIITNQREFVDPNLSHYRDMPIYRFHFAKMLVENDLAEIRSTQEACASVIAEFKPEVIHLNSVQGGIVHFNLQQKRRRLPALLTLHDNFLFQLSDKMTQWALRHVDALATVSDSVRRNALAFDPRLSPRLQVVLNALPVPELSPTPLPPTRRILAFGRLVKEKGFDLAIKAFARIAGRFPDAILTIAGDGSEKASLQKLAVESGIADRIHFSGWVSPEKIPELINEHSLVVMPSRWQEPFGLAALQAAQMGRPLIASITGGIPEIVIDGVTGKLFENENLSALTEALASLLENPELGATLGRQARAHVLEHFDFGRFVTAYENLYARVQNAP
jgi:glycogen(starch) synthase